jgi:hypothetical protein
MNIRTFAIAAGALALGLAAWNTPGKAQGPLWDRVNVDLPYSVSIGDKTLQPGAYVIQQLSSNSGGSRVLLIYSDRGMKFETSAMTIPALDQRTPEDTKVVLHHFGPDYYFDKIWIQGKNYGYEFPLPDSVKSRERERLQPISVAANYSTVPADDTATTSQTTASAATSSQTTASAATSTQTMAPATTSQSTVGQATSGQSTMMAQNTPPATTAPQTAPPATTAPQTMASQDSSSADRAMPDTSAGWLMMLLGGGALSGAGLAIRRKR